MQIVVSKLKQQTVLDHEKRHFKAAKVNKGKGNVFQKKLLKWNNFLYSFMNFSAADTKQ